MFLARNSADNHHKLVRAFQYPPITVRFAVKARKIGFLIVVDLNHLIFFLQLLKAAISSQKDGLFQIIFYWVSLLITLVAFTAIEMLKRCQKDLGIEELPIGKKRPPAEPDAGQLPQN